MIRYHLIIACQRSFFHYWTRESLSFRSFHLAHMSVKSYAEFLNVKDEILYLLLDIKIIS